MPRGGVISLSSLQEILGNLGIEKNAVRTAMSRLASDGWVKRHRVGRQSFYSLDANGRELFETASTRIYASEPQSWNETFELVLRQEESHKTRAQFRQEMRQLGYGSPIPDLYIRPKMACAAKADIKNALAVMEASNLVSGSMTAFIAQTWPVDELNLKYKSLISKYTPVYQAADRGEIDSPQDCLCVRILLIHDWRRLVLQDVDLPMDLKPSDWMGEEARQLIANLYRLLCADSETYLDGCLAAPGDFLPAANSEFAVRFQ